MIGLGTIVNVVAVIVGSSLGILVGHKIPERIQKIFTKIIGLFVIVIGIKMFMKADYFIIVFISVLLGGIAGWLINIEKLLDSFANKIKTSVKIKSESFSEGFISATLLYCVGPMAILGSIADGLSGQHDILFTKSILDGTTAIGFATGLGIGVMFSVIPILIYQGTITIAALFAGSFFSQTIINELTSTGGILMFCIGINVVGILGIKRRIPVGNLLPALAFIVLLVWMGQFFI